MNVEIRDGRPTAPSHHALSEARRVASSLGATVYALVVVDALVPLADTLAEPLGRAGADKILLVVDPVAAGCPIEPLWREVLAAVVDRLRPRLFLWPAGSVGLQLGPLLAVRLGANFFPRASFDLDGGGIEGEPRLLIRRWTDTQDGYWAVGSGAAFAPAVVTLGAGEASPVEAAGAAEIAVLRAGTEGAARGIEALASAPVPQAAAELVSIVVLLPQSDPDETTPLLLHMRPDVMVADQARSFELLDDASPRLVLLLSGRGGTAALARLRLAPDAHVVVLSGARGGPPRSPLVDRVWKIERPLAVAQLAGALAKAPS